jgi:hypothetical protein
MDALKLLAWLAALPFTLGFASAPASTQESGPGAALVYFADGTSLPLRGWTLNYEYTSWPKQGSSARATTGKRSSNEIWTGKRKIATPGLTVEVQYEQREREQEVEGELRRVKVPVARGLVLAGKDGKRTTVKPEPPSLDLLSAGSDKDRVVQALTLELHGETLTGAARDYCILTYSALAECSADPSHQVVKIEFQP